jgi:hypothetical protein
VFEKARPPSSTAPTRCRTAPRFRRASRAR